MKYIWLIIFIIPILSTVDGQQCQAKFNQSITGQCSSVTTCQGTILSDSSCGQQGCCVSSATPSTTQMCISANNFDVLYNTSRATYLRGVLNYGINSAGICNNCQAKAAFLAIAATMTDNFKTDEAVGTDAQFSVDDTMYGNTQAGDGSRFRRRGLFGLRGRTMYERLQTLMPQYQSLTNPESVAITGNAIMIASVLWNNPNLYNGSPLTSYADGSFYGFSMLWYTLTQGIEQLSIAAQYYSKFLQQLQCGGDLYSGQGPVCQYNATHQGICSADCIKGLENSSTYCGCSGTKGQQCPNSPKNIRCCLSTCSQELKMDLGFVLDASGSIGSNDYMLQLNFTKDLLRRVNVGPNKTHVGIINFSSSVQTLTWLNSDYTLQAKLQHVDQAIYYGDGTDTALGLQQANTVFSYANGRRQAVEGIASVIFVITDGASNNQNETIQAANVLKQANIILVSVGVGSGPNLAELYAMCSPPVSENYFAISNYGALEQKINQFTSKTCSEPVTVSSNSTIISEVSKDTYKFLKVPIDTMGNRFLVNVTLFNGNIKLFYSFTNQNPKDPNDFIDYAAKASDVDPSLLSQFKANFQLAATKTSTVKNNEVTLVIDKPNTAVEFAYIGIKGVEDYNKFEVNFDDCDAVNCVKSNVGTMKTSITLMIFFAFSLF